MPKKQSSTNNPAKSPVLRFAHPYYATTPAAARAVPAKDGQRMLDHIQGTLHPIPALQRNNGQWSLDEVIGKDGAAAIAASGKITLHIAGYRSE